MSYQTVLLDRKDGIATITFHRPEALNAINSQMLEDLNGAADEVASDDSVRVVVFTGEGKFLYFRLQIFMKWTAKIANDIIEYSQKGGDVFRKIEQLKKPTIAAVNGYAFGGGMEFLLCTDIRIASERAKLRLPEVTLGLLRAFRGPSAFPNV